MRIDIYREGQGVGEGQQPRSGVEPVRIKHTVAIAVEPEGLQVGHAGGAVGRSGRASTARRSEPAAASVPIR